MFRGQGLGDPFEAKDAFPLKEPEGGIYLYMLGTAPIL